jgi:hypothetical protein
MIIFSLSHHPLSPYVHDVNFSFFSSAPHSSHQLPSSRHQCGEWRKWFYAAANFNLVDEEIENFSVECLTSRRKIFMRIIRKKVIVVIFLNYYGENFLVFCGNELGKYFCVKILFL